MAPWFGIFAGVWGVAMITIFIAAIRLSYRIEARSPELTNRSGFARNAMMFHTITNRRVSRDPVTQALRKRMNLLLLVNVVGFLLFSVFIRLTYSAGG